MFYRRLRQLQNSYGNLVSEKGQAYFGFPKGVY